LGAGPACAAHCLPALPALLWPCPGLCHFPCIPRMRQSCGASFIF
jgi:hypothetical protein